MTAALGPFCFRLLGPLRHQRQLDHQENRKSFPASQSLLNRILAPVVATFDRISRGSTERGIRRLQLADRTFENTGDARECCASGTVNSPGDLDHVGGIRADAATGQRVRLLKLSVDRGNVTSNALTLSDARLLLNLRGNLRARLK